MLGPPDPPISPSVISFFGATSKIRYNTHQALRTKTTSNVKSNRNLMKFLFYSSETPTRILFVVVKAVYHRMVVISSICYNVLTF